jgi:hypothetical protein
MTVPALDRIVLEGKVSPFGVHHDFVIVSAFEWRGSQVLRAQNAIFCVLKACVDLFSPRQVPMELPLADSLGGIQTNGEYLLTSGTMNNTDRTFRTRRHMGWVAEI